MKMSEALQTKTGDEIDVGQEVTKKNKFEKLIDAMKKDDSMAMTYIINAFPRLEIGSTLDKLNKRKKYKKYPGYDTAVSKLKRRRSH